MNQYHIMMGDKILSCLMAVIVIALGVGICLRYIHFLQLQYYRFYETLADRREKLHKYTFSYWLKSLFFFMIVFIVASFFPLANWVSYLVVGLCVVLYGLQFDWLYGELSTKWIVRLKYTHRVCRLLAILILVSIGYYVGMQLVVARWVSNYYYLVGISYFLVLPAIFSISFFLSYLWETGIAKIYYKRTQQKLRSADLLKIGITGSYGKTSTKQILTSILQQKYNVLTTPKNYNTPMGIAKSIKDQNLEDYDVFIAEMGADHVGDIKHLAQQVSPSIGVLTYIGNAHLKTFGSIYHVMRTKYELVECLPKDGLAIFNGNSDYELTLLHKTKLNKCVVIDHERLDRIDTTKCDNLCVIRQVDMSTEGVSVVCVTKHNEYRVRCSLFGRHQADNIGMAILVAEYLGLTKEQIVAGVESVKAVEHRLEVKKEGQRIMLDDSYNCNIVGAKNALEVLGQYEDYEKIVITPGIVELGEDNELYNEKLGALIGEVADKVIVVGTYNKIALTKGVLQHKTKTVLQYAEDYLTAKNMVTEEKCVCLILNDLPDQYQK